MIVFVYISSVALSSLVATMIRRRRDIWSNFCRTCLGVCQHSARPCYFKSLSYFPSLCVLYLHRPRYPILSPPKNPFLMSPLGTLPEELLHFSLQTTLKKPPLVSRTFHRINTPLYFYTIHLRSQGQLHRLLVLVLRRDPNLASHIHKICYRGPMDGSKGVDWI